jgi:integrase
LDLEASPPTVTVKAGYSKRRRLDILPLPTHILEQARGWLSSKAKGAKLWPGDWAANKCGGKMLQIDLAEAGIPYVDDNGLFADFHALRHTYITNLARNGVSAGDRSEAGSAFNADADGPEVYSHRSSGPESRG